jgi:c-di-GMP-binding flagellar brake protein YcgR
MTSQIQSEQRSVTRVGIKLPAKLSLGKERWDIVLLDISEQGCGFQSPRALSEMSQIQLDFTLYADDEVFHLTPQAVVIHSYPVKGGFYIGAQFTHLSAAYQLALHRYIEEAAS